MNTSLPYSYIAIEGNIGAGKTSLAKIMSTKFNADLALEGFAENTFLPQFYENPERFAFPLEMSFLAERYQQLKSQQELSTAQNNLLITDYIFEKSMLFAQVNLSHHELDLFRRFFEMINQSLNKPELILYLHKSTPALLSNIAKRGRDYEKSIQGEYLDKVTEQYHQYLKHNPFNTIIIIESDDLDFVENPSHLRYLLELIQKPHRRGLQRLHPKLS